MLSVEATVRAAQSKNKFEKRTFLLFHHVMNRVIYYLVENELHFVEIILVRFSFAKNRRKNKFKENLEEFFFAIRLKVQCDKFQ